MDLGEGGSRSGLREEHDEAGGADARGQSDAVREQLRELRRHRGDLRHVHHLEQLLESAGGVGGARGGDARRLHRLLGHARRLGVLLQIVERLHGRREAAAVPGGGNGVGVRQG